MDAIVADRQAVLDAYARAYETLAPDTIEALLALTASDIRFKDPFNDLRGQAALRGLFRHMFQVAGDPRFVVHHAALSGETGLLRWGFSAEVGGLGLWRVEGMSEIRFDADNRIALHIDHWDAAEQFYEKLPVIGWLLRLIRRRMRAG